MTEHIPVLLKETIEGLTLKAGDVIVDGTINTGGHSLEISKRIGKDGYIIGIDRDSDALSLAAERLAQVDPKVILIHGNYRNVDTFVKKEGFDTVSGILLDIGFSSRQLADSGRGFTFAKDEPLLMTFDPSPAEDMLTAHEIVNTWDEENIADIIYGYGGEHFSRRIARNIVKKRDEGEINSTKQLAEIIEESVPSRYRKKRIHPATKTFQALRITVNDELGSLREGIENSFKVLQKGGRLVIITFHSGEDRIVKNLFKDLAQKQEIEIITKKPIVPTEEELKNNPKAGSAKLRIAQKT
ncbi:MAG: 16S rRNA (cytosine(1402)-N(4))-methyltransferase RsmH [Candidatus Pacebacteria bacterium]|nr:16S rRNA (cytosine(1402)-N(4))-methyltransferase RsmH [Candidatus Paceibacterota bacterium]